jgi:NAD(P)H-dependent FMN reductase
MSKVLIVTGSVRPNSVNKSVVEAVKADVAAREGVDVKVADLGELNLPFFDALTPPSAESYAVPHDNVERWSALVNDADGVVFAAAEYNHSLSAVQKNAIDWLYKEWAEKPVAFVGYGWYAGVHSLAQFKEIGIVTKWKLGETTTGLQFMKELNLDGSFADETAVRSAIKATVDELVGSL